ncbi:uncharacterized protein ACB058_018169 [Synchiropus picturatus]
MDREERSRKKTGSLQRRRREPLRSPPPPAREEDRRGSGQVTSGREPGTQRKLSDSSNASEDLSKDSGCVSAGKLSASDSSSEISDCTSESNKRDSPCGDLGPGSGREASGEGVGLLSGCPSLINASRPFVEPMTAGDTEELLRELEELRSENEYLKDEVEELRCEMLEMRDVFQEDELFQLQELRLQLEHSNKTCRILQYRLRQAERRSVRGPQSSPEDGEVVRTLEHDVKVARSVSLRLFQDLESLRSKSTQVEQENQELRERTQQLEVTCQVLQGEAERAREILKKRGFRQSGSQTERRLSQHLEDDRSDLHCQLHFAREELSLMCKKLARLVPESEAMRGQLERYHAAYGDIDAPVSPQGKKSSRRSREAELKTHLRLVEEEAVLLSRRIVELEVENRELRSEVNAVQAERKPDDGRGSEQEQSVSLTTREGPVGGEQDPSDCNHGNPAVGCHMTPADYQQLTALRDHACILTSALQLLRAPAGGADEALELLLVLLQELIQRVEALMGGASVTAERDPEDGRTLQLPEVMKNLKHTKKPELNCSDPKMQVSLRVLWVLHQWSSSQRDVKGRERSSLLLQELLDTFGAEVRDKKTSGAGMDEVRGLGGTTGSRGARCCGVPKKNWLYVSREAARVDREDLVKTWDHPVMPLSFPDLQPDLSQRSHTAPERSAVRIYFSPPSARRVRAAQRNLGAGSSPAVPDSHLTVGTRSSVSLPGQHHPGLDSKPLMVSVGLQTEGSPLRAASCRALGSPRPHTSSDRPRSRPDRSRSSSQNSVAGPSSRASNTHQAPAQRYALVTEFLRRVSGRAETQKARSDPKGSGQVQPRPPCAASLHRSDSINRKKGFMRPREEPGHTARTRQDQKSQTTSMGELHDCSTSASRRSAPLSLCFTDKRHRATAVVGASADHR